MTAKKRIHNTKTHKYLAIRQKNTKNGTKGEILGKWHPKNKK
jgi:hypothetical protein